MSFLRKIFQEKDFNNNKVANLKSVEDWDEFKNHSTTETEKIIFKYSTRCPVSFTAEKVFDSWVKSLPEDLNLKISKVNVITARPLSRYLESELNVRHESPQILWLDGKGKVKWFASHYDITSEALENQLK